MTAPVNTEFVSGTTITSPWLNGVNDHINNIESDPHPAYVKETTLASDVGASMVGYNLNKSGSILRNVSDKLGDVVSVKDFGATGDGTTDDTSAIQAAIDYVYLLGGGAVIVPAGTYQLSASASSDTWETYASGAVVVSLPAGSCAIIMRDGVYLQGAGMAKTRLQMASNTGVDGIYVTSSPNGYGIYDLTLDGGWDRSSEINSHGIYWATTTIAGEANTIFSNGVIRNVHVQNVGSYGFGLQNGKFLNNLFDNIRTTWTGADGFDAKNRRGNVGNRITNPTISAFGLRTSLVGQAGIDVRGDSWSIVSPRIIAFGRPDTVHSGIRFNPGGGTNGSPATNCFVTDFVINATDVNTRGIESYGANCKSYSGAITGCGTGVYLRTHADSTASDNVVDGVSVDGGGAAGNGFTSESNSILRSIFANCVAANILNGFRPVGTNEQIIGCSVGVGVTTPLSTAASPVDLVVTASPLLLAEQRAPAFLSGGPYTIEDDAVTFISTGSNGVYQMATIGSASSGAGHPNGMFGFRSSSSPQCLGIALQTVTNIAFSTGVLTGTTGTDGNFTISSVNGGLYLENRTGTSKTVVLTFFGDR